MVFQRKALWVSLAAASLLATNPDPTDADIDAVMTNICRCGTYQRVRAAIHRAAAEMAKTKVAAQEKTA